MPDYPLAILSPEEFESLAKDLLERDLSLQFKAFTKGRDDGTDLCHYRSADESVVVQCKHYARSKFTDLKRKVREEVNKLKTNPPERYILATSLGLTPKNVNELFKILHPFCISKHDIYGESDIQGLLRKNEDIVKRHPKLWIASEPVLTRILNNGGFFQSSMDRETILNRIGLYVSTPQLETARVKLEKDRVCIISGVPGIGKTSLAEMLIIECLAKGWELVSVTQDISEAFNVISTNEKSKQLFYYDDFLGQISSGEKLGKNEDVRLLKFINSVHGSPNKLFILTTREYILEQAKSQHEKLSRSDIDLYKFVVEFEHYDEVTKAQILAKHLYFCDVPAPHVEAVVKDRAYRKIIDHCNYSPRLIEEMTKRNKITETGPRNYVAAFTECFDDPVQVWEPAFTGHLNQAARHVLLALTACSKAPTVDELEKDFRGLHRLACSQFGGSFDSQDFRRSMRELEGNFIRSINPATNERGICVSWHNPSVLDFMCGWLRRNPHDTELILKSATRFEQIEAMTGRVPILLSSTGKLPNRHPSEMEIALAIERTSRRWGWSEIIAILRLAKAYREGHIAEQAIHILSNDLPKSTKRREISEVCSVVDQIKSSTWIPKKKRLVFLNNLKSVMLTSSGYMDIDSLVSISNWANENRDSLSTEEFLQIHETAREGIHDELDCSYYPDYGDQWFYLKDQVEYLEDILAVDFAEEISLIEQKISDAEVPEVGENIESAPRFTKSSETTIDLIFNSLIS